MLKKILEEMFVPEDILNNISDDDKQLIFIEIRKEQIRRYNNWQNSNKSSEEFRHKPNTKGKNIQFANDEELVSFLGERSFDRPIEDILKEETLRRAQQEAERVVLEELGVTPPDKNDVIKNISTVEHVTEELSNVSVDQMDSVTAVTEPIKKTPPEKLAKPISVRVSRTADQKREEMLRRKSTEIYNNLLSQHSFLEETALKENEELAPIWEKAAEQARLDEEQRRKKAVEARKFYDNISKDRVVDVGDPNPVNPPATPTQKSSHLRYVLNAISNFEILTKAGKDKNDIKMWFLENEWNKKRIVDRVTSKVPEWFHGMISRQQSEKLLSTMDVGSFLIRVSEKCFCYVLSYKAKSKTKHILIQSKVECDQYEFLGPPNTIVFKSLSDLVNHFQSHFLSDSNRDILTTACGQIPDSVVDYMNLIQPDSSRGDKKQLIYKCSI